MDTAFSDDFATARGKFLEAVRRADARVESFALDTLRGPAGEELATDVAWFGPTRPGSALIVTSGTHGVEGYVGSALQISIARMLVGATADSQTAIILVHALNPHGFAHTRRVNEDNIDLNRNFIDFGDLPQVGAAYARLHHALVPEHWSGEARMAADAELDIVRAEIGPRDYQEAVCGGQYAFPNGLFYGGRAPAWSNRVWRAVLTRLPDSISCLGHVDMHTGLGPYAHGEILYTLARQPAVLALAKAWYEDLGLQVHGTQDSAATEVIGTMNHAVCESAACPRICTVSIEFGTVEFGRMLSALRADNWLHLHDAPDSPLGRQIKRELRDCFCPDDPQWRKAVILRGMRVLERTYDRLRQWAASQ